MGNRVCSWCSTVMGHTDGLKDGEITHGICDDCMVAMMCECAGVTVPNIDEAFLVDLQFISDGKINHDIQIEKGHYINAAEAFPHMKKLDAIQGMHEIWLNSYRKLSEYRRQGRRARLAKSSLTAKYLKYL